MNRVLVPNLTTLPVAPRNTLPVEFGGETMGTTWRLRAFADQGFNTGRLDADIRALLESIVAQMSPWAPGSDLNRFNALPAGSWFELPAHFRAVVDCALQVAEETDGAFDPSMGALVDLWGFGARPPTRDAPREDQISAARAATGWRTLARDGAKLRQPGGVRLDLNAIAKGYAVDQVAHIAEQAGLVSYLVEIGGELRGAGIKPDSQPWWVELERPPQCDTEQTLAALYNTSIATSGDYRRSAVVDGEVISHTLAPRTGRPIDTGVASVAIIHASCMLADAYATSLQVLGAERGIAFADSANLAAIMITRAPGRFSEHISRAAASLIN